MGTGEWIVVGFGGLGMLYAVLLGIALEVDSRRKEHPPCDWTDEGEYIGPPVMPEITEPIGNAAKDLFGLKIYLYPFNVIIEGMKQLYPTKTKESLAKQV